MTGFRHTAKDERGRYTHEFYWVTESPDYGLLLETPHPDDCPCGCEPTSRMYAAGELCYGCGLWKGEPLKRGEAARFLKRQRAPVGG